MKNGWQIVAALGILSPRIPDRISFLECAQAETSIGPVHGHKVCATWVHSHSARIHTGVSRMEALHGSFVQVGLTPAWPHECGMNVCIYVVYVDVYMRGVLMFLSARVHECAKDTFCLRIIYTFRYIYIYIYTYIYMCTSVHTNIAVRIMCIGSEHMTVYQSMHIAYSYSAQLVDFAHETLLGRCKHMHRDVLLLDIYFFTYAQMQMRIYIYIYRYIYIYICSNAHVHISACSFAIHFDRQLGAHMRMHMCVCVCR